MIELMVRIACDTNEAVEEVIDLFDKCYFSKASVVKITYYILQICILFLT
jgi:hypothetical protein